MNCFSIDNKRLDEWVTADKLDIDHIQLPRKESKSQTPTAAAALIKNTSRAVSPDVTISGASSPLPSSGETVSTNSRRSSVVLGRKRKNENDVSFISLSFILSHKLHSLSLVPSIILLLN